MLAAATAGLAFVTAAQAGAVSGAGATFPYPVYARWAAAYQQKSGVGIRYQPVGSGAGIKRLKAREVTFAGSDRPLEPADLQAAGLVQFPAIIGGVVPVVNLKGVKAGDLVLDGATLALIYLGEVRQWNDPRIQRLTPGLPLPATAITPVHRSDESGTSFLLASYLGAVSPGFTQRAGAGFTVAWPGGTGAKGNEGVANTTAHIEGAIGYVEYAYVKQDNLAYVRLINKAGQTVSPSAASFQSAAAQADWKGAPDSYVILTNQPGAASWPITGASFILLQARPPDPAATAEVLRFFSWAFDNGAPVARELGYVPLPDSVVKQVRENWRTQIEGVPLLKGATLAPGAVAPRRM